jgi:uncharacterized protein YaiI (UPF0178 family)
MTKNNLNNGKIYNKIYIYKILLFRKQEKKKKRKKKKKKKKRKKKKNSSDAGYFVSEKSRLSGDRFMLCLVGDLENVDNV